MACSLSYDWDGASFGQFGNSEDIRFSSCSEFSIPTVCAGRWSRELESIGLLLADDKRFPTTRLASNERGDAEPGSNTDGVSSKKSVRVAEENKA
jgi:hypothetical protein